MENILHKKYKWSSSMCIFLYICFGFSDQITMTSKANIMSLLKKSCDNIESNVAQKRAANEASNKSDAKEKPLRKPKAPKKASVGKKSVQRKPAAKKSKDETKKEVAKKSKEGVKKEQPELPFKEKTWHLDKVLTL